MLNDWVSELTAELGVDLEVDIGTVLDLARDAAHEVARPAAPLTTFIVGYAAAQAGGGPAAVDAAVANVRALLSRREGAAPPSIGP